MPHPSNHQLIECTPSKHADAILEILNEAIASSTALYEYEPRTLQGMHEWFKTKENGNFPVLGIEDNHGRLLAFSSFGPFRAYPAFKHTVEHSVYVHKDHRGLGLGLELMRALIAKAKQHDVHAMIGAIDSSNLHSIAMHEKLGFRLVGTLPQVGFKFGKWLDLMLYQLVLS